MNQMGVLLLEAALGVEPSAGAIPEPVEKPARKAQAPQGCEHKDVLKTEYGFKRCNDCGVRL